MWSPFCDGVQVPPAGDLNPEDPWEERIHKWRSRRCNRKCLSCRHCSQNRGFLGYDDLGWCKAKQKNVNVYRHRWFCSLYDCKEVK